MKTAEKITNMIYDKIRADLLSARLKSRETEDGDKLPLVDYLSKGNTIKSGITEIDDIVEQIDIEDLLHEFASQAE